MERDAPAVVRSARRILGDGHEAEDVAQEAFVIAYRSLPSWRGEGSLRAWVCRIAVRLAVRRATRRRTMGWIAPDESAVPLHAPEDPAEDPALSIVRGDRAARLRAAVLALDEPYREVVALRFFGDRSLQEIAALTGRPLNTVKTHLRRGLERIRAMLDREDVA